MQIRVGRRVVVAGGVAAVGVAAAAITGASPSAWAKPVIRSAIGIPAAAASPEPPRNEITLAFLGGLLELPDYGPTTIVLSVTNTGDLYYAEYGLEWMNGSDGAYTLTFDTSLTEAQFGGVSYPVANSGFAVIPWGRPLPGHQQVASRAAVDFSPGESFFVAFQLTLHGPGPFDFTAQVLTRNPRYSDGDIIGLANFRAVFTAPALALSAYQGTFGTSAFVGSYSFEELRVQVLADGAPFKGAEVTFTIPAEYSALASFDGAPSAGSRSSATGVAFMPRVLYGPETGTATVIATCAESESQVEFEVTSMPPLNGSVFSSDTSYSVIVLSTQYGDSASWNLASVRYASGTRPAVPVPVITIYRDKSVPRYPSFAPITISTGGSPYLELVLNGTVVETATAYTYRDPSDAPFETTIGQRMHAKFDGLTVRATDSVANDFTPGSEREVLMVIGLDPRVEKPSLPLRVTVTND